MSGWMTRIMSVTAIAAVLLSAACSEEVSKAEAEQYRELISEKHDLVGRAIILQGRLIESFNINKDVLDDTKFMDAEGYLEDLLERLGPVEAIESITLPSNAAPLQKLHRQLADSVYFLRECNRSLDDSAYTGMAYAEAAWDKSRVAFGGFTKDLVAWTTGEELPDVQPRELPEYNIGEKMEQSDAGLPQAAGPEASREETPEPQTTEPQTIPATTP